MEYAIPIATLLFGWALGEFTQWLRTRGQRRAAAGRALSELLEVRHYLRGVDAVFRLLRNRLQVSSKETLQGLSMIEILLPPDKTLPERYEAAVSSLSETSPLLAFRLRGKQNLPALLTRLRAIGLNQEEEPDLLLAFENFLRAEGVGTFDEAIRDVAWTHGVKTWWETRRALKHPEPADEGVDEFIRKLEKALGEK